MADVCGNHGSFNSFDSYEEEDEGEGVSALDVLVTVVRKYSLAACNGNAGESFGVEEQLMEIGGPTDVRHVAHVTFDRFDGFLGLPAELEPQVPRRPPSASTKAFGVSTESMQHSIDSRGNCVPTILLMMQKRLYQQGGLQSEGIFRINPENGQEEYVREQLNNGVIPDNIDVHCLAGLIKAWFRELPNGVLDSLPPEEVMEARSEDEWCRLVKLLPPVERALLDWAVNLMADVAQLEHHSKMNARNIAMVFAPNMTQMSDPLTALMFAVQVMTFLKTLIEKALREREDCLVEAGPKLPPEPSNEDDNRSALKPSTLKADEKIKEAKANEYRERMSNQISSSSSNSLPDSRTDSARGFLSSIEYANCDNTKEAEVVQDGNGYDGIGKTQPRRWKGKTGQPRNDGTDVKRKGIKGLGKPSVLGLVGEGDENAETKMKEVNILRPINSRSEMAETWR